MRLHRDFAWTWRATRVFLNQKRWHLLALLAILSAFALALHPSDPDWVRLIRSSDNRFLDVLSGKISHWGDFALYNLGLAVAIWTFGYLRKARIIQRLAIAALMAATFAGITCNVFRFTMGRPRPKAQIEDRFHGIAGAVQGWKYQGFPSGHTATAFGTAVPLLMNAGPLGWAAATFSSSVGWARIYGNQHYPTDVLIGAFFGIAFGVAAGWPLLRIRRRIRRRQNKRRAAVVHPPRRRRDRLLPA